jgi:transcriptional regulator with XRE-family HTH domain
MATALAMNEWAEEERDTVAESAELRRLRATLDWSQERTARRLRISLKTYNGWERGKPCQWPALQLLRRWVEEADLQPLGRRGAGKK